MTQKIEIFVLVHPGSACGSATFNLGRAMASEARQKLIADIAAWRGPFFVIDGSLSDEIGDYPEFSQAIENNLATSEAAGLPSERVWGCDSDFINQVAAIDAIVDSWEFTPAAHRFTLTGAWTSRGGGSGCVDDVHNWLLSRGFESEIRPSAVDE